jgi:Na+(H+)/acetate symporter ActP
VELWPKDGWSVCSRPAGVVYAGCILASLAVYAYINRIAPVAVSVSIIILALVLAAFACLAGTSGQTWTDPSNALAVLLIACAFLLDGFFIAGARTFGPTEVLDVGIGHSGSPTILTIGSPAIGSRPSFRGRCRMTNGRKFDLGLKTLG